MKVLHLISGGDTGGAKAHVLTLLTALKNLGVTVELLCIMESDFTDEAKSLGIPLTVFPQNKRYDMKVLKKIKNFINNSDFDLLHCHGARANYIAALIKGGITIPALTTLHSDYKLDFKDSWYKQLIFANINALALRQFKYILSVTNSFKQMLIERGFKKDRIDVIYNGIDFDSEIHVENKIDFLKKFGLTYDNSKKYIGIAARFQVVKGVKYFLEAAKTVCDTNKDIVFLVAGSGDLYAEFNNYIKKNNLESNIFLLGYVNDINSFYNILDVNVLSSLSESFPYALLEGAKQKKATIATSVGGIPEMIENNVTGFLVPPENSNLLAEKMVILIEDESKREKFGKEFYNKAKNNFSALKMAETHIKIYEKIKKENKN